MAIDRSRIARTGVSALVGRHMARRRTQLGWSQSTVADYMRELGHAWLQHTVSDVERGLRSVTVDELAALSITLGMTMRELLPNL